MTIHFVCVGNTYRSRLAEAYLNSKNISNIHSISSGIHAIDNTHGPISRFTERLTRMYALNRFTKIGWTQTSETLLNCADLTIFFNEATHAHCVTHHGFHSDNFEIWNIRDLENTIQTERDKIIATENTFAIIRKKVNDMIERIKR